MRLILGIVSILILFAYPVCAQQSTAISMFDQNLIYYNPAATGREGAFTADFFFRSHWTGFEGAPSTQAFNAHAPLKNPAVAVGFSLQRQSIGSTNYTGIFFNYAYSLKMNENQLTFGMKGGINNVSQKSVDLRDDQADKAFSENGSFIIPNFGFGFLYTAQNYWGSISVPAIFGFQSKADGAYTVKTDSVNRDFCFAGGGTFKLDPNLELQPAILFIYNSGHPFKYALNLSAIYKENYRAGLGFRSSGALIVQLGYYINRQVGIMYSFDLHLGKTSDFASSSHEISIRYRFGYQINVSNPRGF